MRTAWGIAPLTLDTSSDFFSQAWNEAVEQCKADLTDTDLNLMATLNAPEKLLDDLKLFHQSGANNWTSQLRPTLAPILNVVKNLTEVFMIAMSPRPVELSCFWGLLHLTIWVKGIINPCVHRLG